MNSLYARPSLWARYKTAVEAGEGTICCWNRLWKFESIQRWHLDSSSSSLIFKLDTIRWISLTSTNFYQFLCWEANPSQMVYFLHCNSWCYRSSVRHEALQCPWLSPCSPSLGPSPSREASKGKPRQQPMATAHGNSPRGRWGKVSRSTWEIVASFISNVIFDYIYIVIVLPSEFYEN
jgi:hypothetical protein